MEGAIFIVDFASVRLAPRTGPSLREAIKSYGTAVFPAASSLLAPPLKALVRGRPAPALAAARVDDIVDGDRTAQFQEEVTAALWDSPPANRK